MGSVVGFITNSTFFDTRARASENEKARIAPGFSFRFKADLPAVGNRLRRNRALHSVVIAIVSVASRIGTADL